MTPSISVVLQTRPLDRMACELALAGLFTTDRPLRGGAARLGGPRTFGLDAHRRRGGLVHALGSFESELLIVSSTARGNTVSEVGTVQ